MRNVTLLVALVVVIGVPRSAYSQGVEVKPGDSRVHGEHLQAFTNQWKMKVVRPDGSVLEDAGSWTDELSATTIEGRSCWKRSQAATFKRKTGEVAATTSTVNIFDAKTMAPVLREFERHVAGGDDSKVRIEFRGRSMKIESTTNSKTEVREVATTEAFDFYGGVYALLWAALPLKQDFAATFPSYTEDEKPELVQQVSYKVIGREKIEAGKAGKQETWIVDCDSAIGHLKYWISGTAPYIVRMDFTDKENRLWTLTKV